MTIRDHFTLRNLSLNHEQSSLFTSCKWKWPRFYLFWRVFWALYHVSWWIGNIVATYLDDRVCVAKWFIYLSNWVYTILTVECVLEAVVVVNLRRKQKYGRNRRDETYGTEDSNLCWTYRVMWLLYTLSVTGSLMICVWYWGVLHKGKELTAIRFNTHAVVVIYAILNIIVTSFPLRLLHFVYPAIFGVIYTLFSVIYSELGGTNDRGESSIYPVLNWSKPGKTFILTSISNFVFTPLAHLCAWGVYVLCQKVCNKWRVRGVVYGTDSIRREDCSTTGIVDMAEQVEKQDSL